MGTRPRPCWQLGEPCFAVDRLGCGLLDYREQAQQIELKTGGMTVSPHVLPDDVHLDTYEQVAWCFCIPGRSTGVLQHLFSPLK